MRSNVLTLTALLGFVVSNSAFAGTDCEKLVGTVNRDNDSACYVPDLDKSGAVDDADYARLGAGIATKADYESRFGKSDCDDSAAWRYPGATEVYNDGKDQDCDGKDFIVPSGWDEKNFGVLMGHACSGGNAHRAATLIATCTAASTCDFEFDTLGNKTGGLVLSDGNVLADFYKGSDLGGTTDVEFSDLTPGADGNCEVYTPEQYAYARTHFRGAGGGGGIDLKKAREIAAEEGKKAAEDLEKRLGEGLEKQFKDRDEVSARGYARDRGAYTDLDARFKANEAAIKRVGDEVTTARGSFPSLGARLADQDKKIESASETATSAYTKAEGATKVGAYAEAQVGVLVLVGPSLPVVDDVTGEPTGKILRNATAFGGGAGVNLGAQLHKARIGTFASLAAVSDGGDSVGSYWNLGFEGLGRLGEDSSTYLGGFGAFGQHTTMVDALQANVVERFFLAGLSLNSEITDHDHGLAGIQARLGVGPTSLGFTGDDADGPDVYSGAGFQVLASVGVTFGANTASGR